MSIFLEKNYYDDVSSESRLRLKKKSKWSDVEWKTLEYKADVTSAGSYAVANGIAQKTLNITGDYLGQAKAWKEVRELARQGAIEKITPEEFFEKKQRVYKDFGLPIPSEIHLYARYNTLMKWAEYPPNYPNLLDFNSFIEFQTLEKDKIPKLADTLRIISCSKWNTQPVNNQIIPILQSTEKISKLLAKLDQNSEPLEQKFSIWFGNDEGGFASTLIHHLRENADAPWTECWHPKMHVVGSAHHRTALYGADLDIVIELNPRPEDAVTYEWSVDERVSEVKLKGQMLKSKQIIRLCAAFLNAYENQKTQAHPKDKYELKSAKAPNLRRMRLTLLLGNTTVDLIPALRGSDGSSLFFGSDGEQGNLMYSNASEASRIFTPYKEWNQFLDVIRCLKLLFQEEWNSKHPKVFGAMSETLAVDIALEMGKRQWEKNDFLFLLHACLDKLLWYLDKNQPLPALNDPSADLLPARHDVNLVTQLIETVKQFKALTAEEIFGKIQAVIDSLNLENREK